MWALTYDYLVGYSMKDMSPGPGLARSLGRPRDDGKTWTFHIRDGVKWSDGVPLTAADVAYTYNRVLHGDGRGSELVVLPQRRHEGDRTRTTPRSC